MNIIGWYVGDRVCVMNPNLDSWAQEGTVKLIRSDGKDSKFGSVHVRLDNGDYRIYSRSGSLDNYSLEERNRHKRLETEEDIKSARLRILEIHCKNHPNDREARKKLKELKGNGFIDYNKPKEDTYHAFIVEQDETGILEPLHFACSNFEQLKIDVSMYVQASHEDGCKCFVSFTKNVQRCIVDETGKLIKTKIETI